MNRAGVPWGPFTSLWLLHVCDEVGAVPLPHARSVRRVSAEQVSLLCTPLLNFVSVSSGPLDSFYQKVHISNLTFLEQLVLKLLIFDKFPGGQWIAAEFNEFSCLVMSDSLRSHGPQHARPPCPSPTPRVYSNSCPLSWWCHPTISSSVVPLSFYPQSLPASGSFQMSQLFESGGPEYWSFSFNISPSNEHSGLISFRIDWLDLLIVQEILKSFLQHHSSKASIHWCSTLYSPTLISIHEYWKNHIELLQSRNHLWLYFFTSCTKYV